MESQRLILFFVFSFSVFLLLDAWQREHQPPTAVASADKAAKAAPSSTPSGAGSIAAASSVSCVMCLSCASRPAAASKGRRSFPAP